MTQSCCTKEKAARYSRVFGKPARAIWFVIGAMMLASCAQLAALRGDDSFSNIAADGTPIPRAPDQSEKATSSEQRALLRAAAQENERIVAAYGGIYSNRAVENEIAPIVSRLVATSEAPEQNFQITILNSPAVNAFALPGGYLYITRGLLALANDASEVAAVLAHEMAHITARHGQERLRRARNAEVASRAVRQVITSEDTANFVLAKNQLDFAAFTQAQEFAADEVGVRNAGRAGFDPFAAARFLESMSRFQSYRSNAPVSTRADGPDFLSSHPSTPNRIEQARLVARQFGAPGVGQRDQEGYLKAIDGMVFGDDAKEGFVRDRNFFHPQLRFMFSVPAGYVIDNTPTAVLATARNGDALRFDGVDIPSNVTLETYLGSGWLNGLNPASIRPLNVNGAEAATARARVGEWHFLITVIRTGASTYRMIFATKSPSTSFERAANATVASFRELSVAEAARLSPLRVTARRVEPGDTVRTLSRSMNGLLPNPEEAFRALNGLGRGESPRIGSYVKLVSDSNANAL